MATQESNINCSQVNTFTGFSNIMTSPKSANNRGMAFGGGHKYGLTGLSFQQLDSMRQAKGTLSSKVILWFSKFISIWVILKVRSFYAFLWSMLFFISLF